MKTFVVLKGRQIREDSSGLVSLTDIYEAARSPKNQSPPQWARLPSSGKLVLALHEKLMGKSHEKAKIRISSIYYTKRGDGTYAHPIIAAYAAYLSPKLAIEIKEVWLRYKAGDATLADEILSRASDDDNKWAAARAISRVQRNRFTDVLKRAGVSARGYPRCTDAIYVGLFDMKAAQLKKALGTQVTRDGMDLAQLSQITLTESMAAERIEDEYCRGDTECAEASSITAGFVRSAIEQERASRRKRRLSI